MAMAQMGRSGGGRRGRRGRRGLNSEINVTPLVDVMLVLMLIFMVLASVVAAGVPIELPKTDAKSMPTQQKPLTVTVDINGIIYLQEEVVTLEELRPKLIALAGEGYEERIYLRGDAGGNYGPVMKAMAAINAAGFSNIGLVTDPIQK
ncbi:MAG: biopolymer transporter ExbD [Robiginitomaculum sp.]|nr:biopolymer transporter ExbD [Robiginitomaculum sp.]